MTLPAPATSLPPAALATQLGSPPWRLSNLYTIKREDTGALIPFRPRPAQQTIIDAVYTRGEMFIIIIKSRRYGFSTLIDLLFLDRSTFTDGFQASIVDMTQKDSQQKMTNIIHVGWDNLPATLRGTFKQEARSSEQLAFRHQHGGGSALSAIYAGTNARGGTNHGLHITEWGKVQATDTARSREILTGALPSARKGLKIVETTWEGGKRGELYDIVKRALETPEEHKGPHDPRVYFFPWYKDPECTDPQGHIDADNATYLDRIQAELKITLTDGQKRFYARNQRELGIFIFREYPSTLEEALRAPVEGAIYADAIAAQRARTMVAPYEIDTRHPVHTFWDLGAPENSPVWFCQFLETEVRFIDFDQGQDEDLTRRIARWREKGYPFGTAFLPHDAQPSQKTGTSFRESLHAAGWATTVVVPRRPSGSPGLWEGINRVRQMFPTFRFRLPHTDPGLEALENYHTHKIGDIVIHDEPVHDWSSHAADAIRVLGEASLHGLLPGRGPNRPSATRSQRATSKPRTGLR